MPPQSLPLLAALIVTMTAAATPALAQTTAPDAYPIPTLPTIPDRTFRITDFGALPDAKTLSTAAIQKTIDACAQAGGGTVIIPAGTFLTGPFTLASNLHLHLEKDALLKLSDNLADFPLANNRYQNIITANNCHDLTLSGPGVIDGSGAPWWKKYAKRASTDPEAAAVTTLPHRPFLIVINNCQRVLVENLALQNSPSFHLVPQRCTDVTIDNVHFLAPQRSPNTDALDPSGKDFLITRCTFDVGDDCIAFKPSSPLAPGQPACENFTVTHCTFLHGHGLSIGGQTPGGMRNLIVSDCSFDSTDAGIRMKANRGEGGLVENLSYSNLTMKNVKVPILITSYYPTIPKAPEDDPVQPIAPRSPIWRHIRITNVTSTNSPSAGRIIGLPELPISDLILTNVNISADKGLEIIHANAVQFINCTIAPKQGPALLQKDAQSTGLNPTTGK